MNFQQTQPPNMKDELMDFIGRLWQTYNHRFWYISLSELIDKVEKISDDIIKYSLERWYYKTCTTNLENIHYFQVYFKIYTKWLFVDIGIHLRSPSRYCHVRNLILQHSLTVIPQGQKSSFTTFPLEGSKLLDFWILKYTSNFPVGQ